MRGKPNTVMATYMSIDTQSMRHSRDIYNFLDFIADMGGVRDTLVQYLGIIVFPITYFLFRKGQIQDLFLVKTSEEDKDLFVDGHTRANRKVSENVELNDTNIKPFVLSTKDSFRLYLATTYGSWLCPDDRVAKQMKAFDEGSERTE